MAAGIDKIREIAERVAQSSGLEVVDLELLGGGKARMLRVYIDKPGGVTHDDCSNFSREAGTIFDVEDAVPGGTYTLEVSSPGLDRKLSKPQDFERFVGSLMKLMTRDPVNGNRHFEGRLKSFEGGQLKLELTPRKKSKKHQEVEPGTEVEIAFSNVEKANLVPGVLARDRRGLADTRRTEVLLVMTIRDRCGELGAAQSVRVADIYGK